MDVARIMTRAQVGLLAPLVHVEVHLASGLPTFSIVGLAATTVKESKERVRSALLNSKFEFPAGRITVNLAPADVPKEGGRYDLPIAVGILIASGQLKLPNECGAVPRVEIYGELALGGEIKPVGCMLLPALHATQMRHELIVSREDAAEACIAQGCRVRSASTLVEVVKHLRREEVLALYERRAAAAELPPPVPRDLRDIRGQLQAKRALAIAAAGDHSLLMVGPPGSGKSMLAQRLPDLLPPLTDAEALEVATIASASNAGFDPRTFGRRPFRAPHHTASVHALVGGGSRARPGEISLAHRGVLFLDELPEFERRALEALREPLETGVVAVSRVALQAEYPAAFQLVAAMNPCPCGYRGDPGGRCECTPGRIDMYRAKVSGPLLDRIDLRIEVPAPSPQELAASVPAGESTAQVAEKVADARKRQIARAGKLNSRLSVAELSTFCRLNADAERVFWQSQAKLGMSARSYHHTLRVARTIADLEASDAIEAHHIAETLQLKRGLR